MQTATQTMTIEEFQKALQSNVSQELMELLQKMTVIAKPEDVRNLNNFGDVIQGWFWATWG